MNEDLGCRTGIAADSFRRTFTDESDADGGAECGKADVNASSDLCDHYRDVHDVFLWLLR